MALVAHPTTTAAAPVWRDLSLMMSSAAAAAAAGSGASDSLVSRYVLTVASVCKKLLLALSNTLVLIYNQGSLDGQHPVAILEASNENKCVSTNPPIKVCFSYA